MSQGTTSSRADNAIIYFRLEPTSVGGTFAG